MQIFDVRSVRFLCDIFHLEILTTLFLPYKDKIMRKLVCNPVTEISVSYAGGAIVRCYERLLCTLPTDRARIWTRLSLGL